MRTLPLSSAILVPSELLASLLGPQSRFGDKLLIIRVLCPHIWECGAKGVKTVQPHRGLQVLVETPLVVVGEEFLRVSNVLSDFGVQRCVSRPSQIHARRPERLPPGLVLLLAHDSSGILPRIPCHFFGA